MPFRKTHHILQAFPVCSKQGLSMLQNKSYIIQQHQTHGSLIFIHFCINTNAIYAMFTNRKINQFFGSFIILMLFKYNCTAFDGMIHLCRMKT